MSSALNKSVIPSHLWPWEHGGGGAGGNGIRRERRGRAKPCHSLDSIHTAVAISSPEKLYSATLASHKISLAIIVIVCSVPLTDELASPSPVHQNQEIFTHLTVEI